MELVLFDTHFVHFGKVLLVLWVKRLVVSDHCM